MGESVSKPPTVLQPLVIGQWPRVTLPRYDRLEVICLGLATSQQRKIRPEGESEVRKTRRLRFEQLDQRLVLASPFGTPVPQSLEVGAIGRPAIYDLKPNAFVDNGVIRNYFFGPPPDAIYGVYRSGSFLFDTAGRGFTPGEPTPTFEAGSATALPVVGDWNGDGLDEVGLFEDGNWLLFQHDGTEVGEFQLGRSGDVPVVGDWNGDGEDDLGVFRTGDGFGSFILDDSIRGWQGGDLEIVVGFGLDSAQPISGDWDADGVYEVGVFQNGEFFLTFEDPSSDKDGSVTQPIPSLPFYDVNQSIALPDVAASDLAVAFDHDRDGVTEVGVFRDSAGFGYFHLDTGPAGFGEQAQFEPQQSLQFGLFTDKPIIGDWYDPAPRRHIPGDRILLTESADGGTTWSDPQVVYVGDWQDTTIGSTDHLAGSPSVVKHNDTYYMFVEGIGTEVFVVNRFLDAGNPVFGDAFVTNSRSFELPGELDIYLTDEGTLRSDTMNFGLGYASPYPKVGTHPIFAGEVIYQNGPGVEDDRVNRYLSTTPIDPGLDEFDNPHRQLNNGVPVFYLFDSEGEGRVPLKQYFDLFLQDTFSIYGEDDPLLTFRQGARLIDIRVTVHGISPVSWQRGGWLARCGYWRRIHPDPCFELHCRRHLHRPRAPRDSKLAGEKALSRIESAR